MILSQDKCTKYQDYKHEAGIIPKGRDKSLNLNIFLPILTIILQYLLIISITPCDMPTGNMIIGAIL